MGYVTYERSDLACGLRALILRLATLYIAETRHPYLNVP